MQRLVKELEGCGFIVIDLWTSAEKEVGVQCGPARVCGKRLSQCLDGFEEGTVTADISSLTLFVDTAKTRQAQTPWGGRTKNTQDTNTAEAGAEAGAPLHTPTSKAKELLGLGLHWGWKVATREVLNWRPAPWRWLTVGLAMLWIATKLAPFVDPAVGWFATPGMPGLLAHELLHLTTPYLG